MWVVRRFSRPGLLQRFSAWLWLMVLQAVTLTALAATPSTVIYHADVLPEQNQQAFHRYVACDDRSLVNGSLRIIDTDETRPCTYYYRTDPLVPEDRIEMNFRVRVNTAGSNFPPPNRAVAIGILDGLKSLQVGLSQYSIALLGKDGMIIPGTEVPLDTSVFHVYRVVKDADQTVSLYVDGQRILQFPYDRLAEITVLTEVRQFFGGASSPGVSNSDWDFVSYTITPAQQDTQAGYQQGYQDGLASCQGVTEELGLLQAQNAAQQQQIIDLQTEVQQAWTEGYDTGVVEGQQQCTNDPRRFGLYSQEQLNQQVDSAVRQSIDAIASDLPRGILVSLCKRRPANPLCQSR